MLKKKVCGMKYPDNIDDLIKLNLDFIGFIFYPKSKRYIGEDFNTEIIDLIPPDISKVGVFVNSDSRDIILANQKYSLDYIQLHGDESPEFCNELKNRNMRIIKAFGVNEDFDFHILEKYSDYCDFFLFDTKSKDYGGTGVKFDWKILDNYKLDIPFLLSGGIDSDSSDEIKNINHPQFFGIDINSQFEIEPGIKNIEMIEEFFEKIN